MSVVLLIIHYQLEYLCISQDASEPTSTGVVLIGEDADAGNPLDTGEYCFNISVEADDFKEGIETFTLTLQSDDECVCLGRDTALVRVQANGGK